MPGGGFLPVFKECESVGNRVVLHSDLNSFFASVEIARDPTLADFPIAVCGSVEERHGIVLAKNGLAKRFGIETGEPVGVACAKCPGLRVVPPHYDEYEEYSYRVRQIYGRYTELVESFGIDECWLDVSASQYLFGGGREIADRLRREIRETVGITASVGVSFCKVFAKLGSDMKKPDAVTEIPRETFRERIWHLPAGDMLGVGRATAKKLAERSVYTIGDLANTSPTLLRSYFGKVGRMLWAYANGLDASPVLPTSDAPVKSVGHGTTPESDLCYDDAVETLIVGLSVDIGRRLRRLGMAAQAVAVAVRDNALVVKEYSAPLPRPTQSALVLSEYAFKLFCRSYHRERPVRSLTVRATDLVAHGAPRQLDIFEPVGAEEKRLRLCETVDDIRETFGRDAIVPAKTLTVKKIKDFGYGACNNLAEERERKMREEAETAV